MPSLFPFVGTLGSLSKLPKRPGLNPTTTTPAWKDPLDDIDDWLVQTAPKVAPPIVSPMQGQRTVQQPAQTAWEDPIDDIDEWLAQTAPKPLAPPSFGEPPVRRSIGMVPPPNTEGDLTRDVTPPAPGAPRMFQPAKLTAPRPDVNLPVVAAVTPKPTIPLAQIRPPAPGEVTYFKAHPDTPAMATEDNFVTFNPFVTMSDQDRAALRLNESVRIVMGQYKYAPTSSLTAAQRKTIKGWGGAYASNEGLAKQTIVARILSGDDSLAPYSAAQQQEAQTFATSFGKKGKASEQPAPGPRVPGAAPSPTINVGPSVLFENPITNPPPAPASRVVPATMSAPTLRERFNSVIDDVLGSLSEQPAAKAMGVANDAAQLARIPYEGAKQTGRGLIGIVQDSGTIPGLPGPPPVSKDPVKAMNAISDVLEGTAKMATVALPVAAAYAPLSTAATVLLSGLASDRAAKLAKDLGASEEAQRLAGNAAAIAVAGVGAKGIAKVVAKGTAQASAVLAETAGRLGQSVGESVRARVLATQLTGYGRGPGEVPGGYPISFGEVDASAPLPGFPKVTPTAPAEPGLGPLGIGRVPRPSTDALIYDVAGRRPAPGEPQVDLAATRAELTRRGLSPEQIDARVRDVQHSRISQEFPPGETTPQVPQMAGLKEVGKTDAGQTLYEDSSGVRWTAEAPAAAEPVAAGAKDPLAEVDKWLSDTSPLPGGTQSALRARGVPEADIGRMSSAEATALLTGHPESPVPPAEVEAAQRLAGVGGISIGPEVSGADEARATAARAAEEALYEASKSERIRAAVGFNQTSPAAQENARMAAARAGAPTAVFAFEQPAMEPGEPGLKLYNVNGGPLDKSTVSAETLQANGIAVPADTAPMVKPAEVKAAKQNLKEVLRTKTPTDGNALLVANDEYEKARAGGDPAVVPGNEPAPWARVTAFDAEWGGWKKTTETVLPTPEWFASQGFINREKVEDIKANFDDLKGGKPQIVQTADGTLIIDGHHRLAAAMELGQPLEVQVYQQPVERQAPAAAKSGVARQLAQTGTAHVYGTGSVRILRDNADAPFWIELVIGGKRTQIPTTITDQPQAIQAAVDAFDQARGVATPGEPAPVAGKAAVAEPTPVVVAKPWKQMTNEEKAASLLADIEAEDRAAAAAQPSTAPAVGQREIPDDYYDQIRAVLEGSNLNTRRPLLAALFPDYATATPDESNDFHTGIWGELHQPDRFGAARIPETDLSQRIRAAWDEGRLPRPVVTGRQGQPAVAVAQASGVAPEPAKESPSDEIRRMMNLDADTINAFIPEESVSKSGRHWSYTTVEGNSHPGLYDTKREAVQAAERHKAVKLEQLDDPESYFDLAAIRASEDLKKIEAYQAQGLSEMAAGARVRAEREGAAPVTPAAKAKPTKGKKGLSDWTEIGKNAIGQTLYEDQRGVRSYLENGVRLTEAVHLRPTKAGTEYSTDRTGDKAEQWEVVTPPRGGVAGKPFLNAKNEVVEPAIERRPDGSLVLTNRPVQASEPGAMESGYSKAAMRQAFNLTDAQAEAADALVQAMGLDTKDLRVVKGGLPADGALYNPSYQSAKGAAEFAVDGKTIIRGLQDADVSTAIHELAHVARRQLINRNVPADERQGITLDDIEAAEAWAGSEDGVWTVKAEEKFARGYERYLRDGFSPIDELMKVFDAISRWLQGIYKTLTDSAVDVKISPAMADVFAKLSMRLEHVKTGREPWAESQSVSTYEFTVKDERPQIQQIEAFLEATDAHPSYLRSIPAEQLRGHLDAIADIRARLAETKTEREQDKAESDLDISDVGEVKQFIARAEPRITREIHRREGQRDLYAIPGKEEEHAVQKQGADEGRVQRQTRTRDEGQGARVGQGNAQPEETAGARQAKEEVTPERTALIDRIVAAAREPKPDIVASRELKGSDGKWYHGGNFPIGVKSTDEVRTVGYVIRTPDGTTVGQREATAEAVLERWQKYQDRKEGDLRSHLESETKEGLQSQAVYWLKDKAPGQAIHVDGKGRDADGNWWVTALNLDQDRVSISQQGKGAKKPRVVTIRKFLEMRAEFAKGQPIEAARPVATEASIQVGDIVLWTNQHNGLSDKIRVTAVRGDAIVGKWIDQDGREWGHVERPLTTVTRVESAPAPQKAASGATVSFNQAQSGVEIKFAAKPTPEVIASVKAAGFRWSKSGGHWYRKVKPSEKDRVMAAAETLVGATAEEQGFTIGGRVNKETPEQAAKAAERAKLEAENKDLIAKLKLAMKAPDVLLQGDEVPAPAAPRINRTALVLTVQLVGNYVQMGVVDFRDAVRRFQEDYGEGARDLDRYFSLAWQQEFGGNRLSVADALAAAYTTEGAANGKPLPGPGQRNAPLGAGPHDVRGGGQGSLGEVPAETGEVPEGVGPGRPGPGDTERNTPGGVPDRPGVGEQPETAPGAGQGIVPPGGVPAAGSPASKGAVGTLTGTRPSDYTLTPERIAGIINRGPIQRFKDNVAVIRLVKDLQAEQRYPSADEQDLLAKYVGWGASEIVKYLEDSPRHDWSANERTLWQELRDMTTEDQRKDLIRSSPNAHFTFDLYRPIWSALRWMGFTGGRVLEPAVGVGHAIGFMPADVLDASTISASELEPLTAAIAAYLYPSAKVQAVGYEKIRLPRNTQDLVISNVPFGAFGVVDKLFDSGLKFLTTKIHNYFFAKALEHVRPGGYIVFVTSRYTMDGPESTNIRRYLMEHAHFIGAVRLPNAAFKKTAKTEVVTDVIVLQKFAEGETVARNAEIFIESPKVDRFSTPESKDYRGRTVKGQNVYRSAWYTEHPQFLLGTESMAGSMRSGNEYTVEATKDEDLTAALETALKIILPQNSYQAATTTSTEPTAEVAEGTFKPGELRVGPKNTIQRVLLDGTIVDATPTVKKGGKIVPDLRGVQRVTGMIAIRDARRVVIAAMRSSTSDDREIKKAQGAMLRAYKAFAKEFGELHAQANKRAFAADPEVEALLALEITKPSATLVKNKAGKETLRVKYEVERLADIFTKRTINVPPDVVHVDNLKDALIASLGVKTRIEWPFMARISGDGKVTQERIREIQESLHAGRHIFRQPDGQWVVRDEYLSGDVVAKLADAEAAAAEDPFFESNVKALTEVQPAPKTAAEIQIALGVHWVEPEDVARFVYDELGVESGANLTLDGTAQYVNWNVNFEGRVVSAGARHRFAVKYGAHNQLTYGFTDLLEAALNLKTPTLGYTEEDALGNRHFVKQDGPTLAARANIEELRSLWMTWVYSTPDVLARIVNVYNTRYNRTVKREYDGSHLANYVNDKGEPTSPEDGGVRSTALPGLALPFSLFPHQLRAIWRALTSGNTLLAHEVGAGKTYEMIAIAMEMRRSGRARKPLITVPTYLLAQWRKDILTAYPTAKLLAFEEQDLAAGKRKEAMARIAHGDWDIVLVPHSSFELLKVSPQRMADTLQEWVAELLAAEAELRAERGDDDPSVKEMEAARRRLEDKIQALLDKADKGTDAGIVWEELGVDALIVDEAASFKNLYFFTRMGNIRGLSKSTADKSLDMFIKIKDINEASKYRNIVFATATPVMNSLAEVYTMQRYLQPQRLRDLGFENFDNWYRTFAEAKAVTEKRPDGSYQEVMRVAKFRNVKLLSRVFSEVMDYIGWDDMPYLKLPKLKNGKVTIVQGEKHPMYDVLEKWFSVRLAAIKELPPHWDKNKREYIAPDRYHPITGADMGRKDNILTVMGDAKLAAIDPRLVLGDYAKDVKDSRVQMVAKDVADYYKREHARKGVTLLFLDSGTPKAPEPLEFLRGVTIDDETGGESLGVEDALNPETEEEAALASADFDGIFNLYEATKAAMVARGIPSREIAFIHQARNPSERLALFEAVQQGKIRVLMASTDKGGLGMNVQDLGGLLIEMDPPRFLRPGDIRQRHGRFIRQGNTFKELEIRRYVTKGTTDEWAYDVLSKKQDMITGFMHGDVDQWEEDDPTTISLEEAMLRATNDPRGKELIELRAALPRLQAQGAAAERAVAEARSTVSQYKSQIRTFGEAADRVAAWAREHFQKMVGDQFSMTVGDKTFTKRQDVNKALIAALKPIAVETLGLSSYERRGLEWKPVGEIGGVPVIARSGGDYAGATVDIALNADALGEGEVAVSAVMVIPDPANGSKLAAGFAEGRNIIASLADKYNGLPERAEGLRANQRWAQEQVDRAEKLLANPPDVAERATKAAARIIELEGILRSESAAKEAEAKRVLDEQRLARQTPPAGPSGNASMGGYADLGPGGTATLHPVEFPEMVALAKELIDTPEVVKRFRKEGKQGEFAPGRGRGAIRLRADLFKKGNEVQLAATLAHEIGHLADWLPDFTLKRGNLLGRIRTLTGFLKGKYTASDGITVTNKDVRDELLALSKMWRPWDPADSSPSYNTYRKSGKELYADAISVLLNNPGLLEQEAPVFFEEFFAELDRKPEVKRAYEDLQDLLSGTRESLIARRRARVQAGALEGEQKALDAHRARQTQREAAQKSAWFRLRSEYYDKNTVINDLVVAAKKRGVTIPEDEDPRYFLKDRNYLGGKMKGAADEFIQPIRAALADAGVSWTAFHESLMYDRIEAGDRSEYANPEGLSPANVAEMQATLKAGFTPDQARVLERAKDNLRGWLKGLSRQAHDVGLITDEMMAQIEANPAYVPFRVVEHIEDNVSWRVYKQVGTLKSIGNTADAAILKGMATIRAIERQKILVATFAFMEQHAPMDIKQAEERWSGKTKTPVEPPKASGLELVYYYDHGKLRGKLVSSYVADSLNNKSVGQNASIVRALSFVNSHWFRPVFTTFNLAFQTKNFARDLQRTWANRPDHTLGQILASPFTLGKFYVKGIPLSRVRAFGPPVRQRRADGTYAPIAASRMRAAADLIEAEEAGIIGLTWNDMMRGRDVADTEIEQILGKIGIGPEATKPFVHGPFATPAAGALRVLQFIEEVGNFIETLPKAAAIYEYAGDGSISDISPAQRAYIREKVGSPDFRAGGTHTPVSNNLLLFSNAFLHGTGSDLEVMRGAGGPGGRGPGGHGYGPGVGPEGPKTAFGFWWKTALLNIVPKIAMFAAMYLLARAATDDEDDSLSQWRRMLRAVSEYDMTNYLPIPFRIDEHGNVTYFRMQQSDTGRLLGGLVWKALQFARGDKDAMASAAALLEYTAGQTPGFAPSLQLVGDIAQFATGGKVYDPFRDRFLFTDDEARDLNRGRKLKKFLSYEFQSVGGAIVWKFYPGELRPEMQTVGQKILDLPILSSVVGGWVKVSAAGTSEKLRAAGAVVQSEEATRRLDERSAVNAAIREFQQRPAAARTPAAQPAVVSQLYRDLYGDVRQTSEEQDRTKDRLTKKLKMGIVRGGSDPLIDAVLSATSNEQKIALVLDARESMSPANFQTWLRQAVQQGVLSPTALALIRKRQLQMAAAR